MKPLAFSVFIICVTNTIRRERERGRFEKLIIFQKNIFIGLNIHCKRILNIHLFLFCLVVVRERESLEKNVKT